MPIGFWAVSRSDVKDCLAYYMKDYHKDPQLITGKDIDRFNRQVIEKLNNTLQDAFIDYVIEK